MKGLKKLGIGLACAAFVLTAAPARVSAAVAVGDKPQLAMKSLDGSAVTSESLKGKLVLLDFWATWCGPCVAEAPHMVKVHQEYGPKGLAVIGVSLDRDVAALKTGVKQLNFTWPQVLDTGNKLSGEFGVSGIPRVFLLGPDGTVLWTGHRRHGGRDDGIGTAQAVRERPGLREAGDREGGRD